MEKRLDGRMVEAFSGLGTQDSSLWFLMLAMWLNIPGIHHFRNIELLLLKTLAQIGTVPISSPAPFPGI